VNLADGTTVLNVEYFTNLTLGSGNDRITYTQLTNTQLRRSSNTINAGSGDDTINAGIGQDKVDGGAGVDLLIVDYSSIAYAEDYPPGGITNSIYSNGSGGFNGYYYAYVNTQWGYYSTLFSNIETFQITGTSAGDTIRTGDGDDLLIGGIGSDTLTGGGGSDRFHFHNSAEGVDSIIDFNGASDWISVSASGFGGGLSAGIDLVATGRYVENTTGTATSAAGVGQFIYQSNTSNLWWDADGSGGQSAVLLANLRSPQAWSGSRIQVL
jgi:Ca2+-binding RTX toxin-like protein